MGSLHLINTQFHIGKLMGRMDGYDRFSAMWMFLMLLHYILTVAKTITNENSYNDEFYVCFFSK